MTRFRSAAGVFAVFAVFVFGSALGACSKSEPPAPLEPAPVASPPPAVASPPTVPSLATAAPLGAAPGVQELPTEEDFEDESAAAISGDNLDAQLDALEREILAE